MDQSNLSAYELERLENMRRNAAHLASLGLDDASSAPARSRGGASSRKRPAAPRPLPTAQAVRRSSRQRVAVTPYTDATPLPDARRAPPPSSASHAEPVGYGEPTALDAAGAAAMRSALESREPAERGSTRGVRVDVPALLRGGLGEHVAGPSTKASVVALLAGAGGSGRQMPRFSKYAGGLEWENAVSLFINIGGSDYNNTFSHGGQRVSWFGGSKMHLDTPLVQRLLTGAEAEEEGGEGGEGAATVLLFCREVGRETGAYVCCGRLRYVQHWQVHPLKFEWDLLDFDELAASKPPFKALMRLARPSTK